MFLWRIKVNRAIKPDKIDSLYARRSNFSQGTTSRVQILFHRLAQMMSQVANTIKIEQKTTGAVKCQRKSNYDSPATNYPQKRYHKSFKSRTFKSSDSRYGRLQKNCITMFLGSKTASTCLCELAFRTAIHHEDCRH